MMKPTRAAAKQKFHAGFQDWDVLGGAAAEVDAFLEIVPVVVKVTTVEVGVLILETVTFIKALANEDDGIVGSA